MENNKYITDLRYLKTIHIVFKTEYEASTARRDGQVGRACHNYSNAME